MVFNFKDEEEACVSESDDAEFPSTNRLEVDINSLLLFSGTPS